jgi:hypothetical protein
MGGKHQGLRVEISWAGYDPPPLLVSVNIPNIVIPPKYALTRDLLGVKHLLLSMGLPFDIISNFLRFMFRMPKQKLM